MNTRAKLKIYFWTSFIVLFIQTQHEAFASHAQSADITYQCLGGNQYQISLSFYRDCAGVAAPNTASIDISSASCGQNLTVNLNQIPGTGIDVSPICSAMNSECSGGTYPGVQEYIYRGIVTLPSACDDWVFSFSLCCRNASIGTIMNPASENIYVEANLDNLNFPCNSSPSFSNDPIPFVCVGQPYCFNNGSSDIDGDSLSYTLITPMTSPTTTVTYISPYSAAQPLASSPAVTFNGVTGDMCMTPTMLQVTVFAILVEEWRGGERVGSVMRDVQLRTVTCTNNNPYVNGINNTGTYTLTACAGTPISFNISTFDVDASQNVSLTWNNGIPAGTFSTTTGSRPTGTFSWTPTMADISTSSQCFTVTVQDDNCPYNGSQTYSFCITVTGLTLSTTTTPSNCGASNGTAQVNVLTGTGPFTYLWSEGSSSANQNGLFAGTYSVYVTGAGGCSATASATVGTGAAHGNINMNVTDVACYGAYSGAITANVTGGGAPYTYLWSTGATTSGISSLPPGTYTVTVTTSAGCVSSDTATITSPAAGLSYSMSTSQVLCSGAATGSASITVNGGTAPYSYSWNTTPVQTSATASNLPAGNYTVTVTDDNGCTITGFASINEPPALAANAMTVNNISCNGLSDGQTTVGATGGSGPYSYSWNSSPVQNTQLATGLAPGTYIATVTDMNGCSATSSVTVTEPSPLTYSSAVFPVSCNGLCDGQTVMIPSGGTASYTYQWLPSGGTSASATGLCPGTYTGTITDANGCTVSTTLAVTQPTAIVVAATGDATICAGQNTLISASATGGTGAYTYSWTGAGTGATQNVSPVIPSTYIVSVTDANGCSGNTASVDVNVTSLTAANLAVSSPSTICYGNTALVSSSVTGNTGAVTINWSSGLGAGNGPFTVAPATSTTYTVTVTDACGVSITGTVPVTVNPLPVIDLSPQSATACNEVNMNFMDNSTGNAGASYSWNFGDGGLSSLVSPSHTYTTTGIYTVHVTVTSSFGCVNTASTSANVVVNPGTQALFSTEAMDGTIISPTYKFYSNSVNAASHQWFFGDGGTSTLSDPVHTYPDKGEYEVKLVTTTTEGCMDSIIVPMEIRPVFTLYIPNAFTPNGNGNNDFFTAKGAEINEFKMMIFDRWGELIYQSDDISKGWDGTAKNGSRISQQGVYVYKISVRDFEHRYHDYTGHVTLLPNE